MGSALEFVRLPSALKVIGLNAFRECKNIRSIEFPTSLRKIAQGAFAQCSSLKTVKFNEGLEALGTDEYTKEGKMWAGVFYGSAVGSVTFPFTLKRIEYNAFA